MVSININKDSNSEDDKNNRKVLNVISGLAAVVSVAHSGIVKLDKRSGAPLSSTQKISQGIIESINGANNMVNCMYDTTFKGLSFDIDKFKLGMIDVICGIAKVKSVTLERGHMYEHNVKFNPNNVPSTWEHVVMMIMSLSAMLPYADDFNVLMHQYDDVYNAILMVCFIESINPAELLSAASEKVRKPV